MAVVNGKYSCCVALPIQDNQGELRKLSADSGQRVARFSRGGQVLPIKKGLHLSLAEFKAPNLQTANRINSLALKEIKKFQGFDITTFNGHVELFSGVKKDFVVVPVKTEHKKKNKSPRVLMALSTKVNNIVTRNGGTLLFPNFKPHITIGKITPKGVSNGVRLPHVNKLHLQVKPNSAFAFKPFVMA
jgi:hypothetical protein